MNACSHCGTDNAAEAAYCRGCGRPLTSAASCPTCGHINPSGSRFCSGCGSALERTRNALAAEPQAVPSDMLADQADGTPRRGAWAELSRLVRELSTSETEPAEEEPSPVAMAVADTKAEPGDDGDPCVELALADCVAGNGLGPARAPQPRSLARLDADKALAQMAAALPVPPVAARIPRRRLPWREFED